MNIRQMITYLEQNYADRMEMPINFTMLTPEDMFYALQRVGFIDENQDYRTYQQDKPLDYYLFIHYWVEDVMAGYDFSWNFFDMVEDHYLNYYDEEYNARQRRDLVVEYVMELNPNYTEEEASVYVELNHTNNGGN
jgi:hypothetical protein